MNYRATDTCGKMTLARYINLRMKFWLLVVRAYKAPADIQEICDRSHRIWIVPVGISRKIGKEVNQEYFEPADYCCPKNLHFTLCWSLKNLFPVVNHLYSLTARDRTRLSTCTLYSVITEFHIVPGFLGILIGFYHSTNISQFFIWY